MSVARVLTWNLNSFSRGRRELKLQLLDDLEWNIAALQECDQKTAALIRASARVDHVVSALDLVPSSLRANENGCVLLARGGKFRNPRTWPSTAFDPDRREQPFPERCLAAEIQLDGTALTAISFHAPFVAGDSEEQVWRTARKESAYQLLIDGLGTIAGPVVVGMDANAWTDPADLHAPDPDGLQPITNSFHLADPPHRLVDIFRAWLDDHPDVLERLRRRYPQGPLATTHNRGNNNQPKACRMDRIYASPVRRVRSATHGYGEAIAAASDHAYVLAEIELS